MAPKLDFEFPQNFDRELGNLRAAAKNVQNAPAELGLELRAYIDALKRLNAEMLGSLDPFLRALAEAKEGVHGLNGPPERRMCQGPVARAHLAEDIVRAESAPISNRRGHRRIAIAWASPR